MSSKFKYIPLSVRLLEITVAKASTHILYILCIPVRILEASTLLLLV